MIDRRTYLASLAGLAAAPAVELAPNGQQRLMRTEIGMAALCLDRLRRGAGCEVRGNAVYWRGQLLGFLPASALGPGACEIVRARRDEDGRSEVVVRLG